MIAAGASSGKESRDSTLSARILKPQGLQPGADSCAASQTGTSRLALLGALSKRRQLVAAGILALTLGVADSGLGQRLDLSPASSCAQIVAAIKRLAVAEHRQAQALELMARGGDAALVEGKFQILLERKRELSYTLKRISMDPVASDASVNRCLSNGYQALYQSERLSANIERILLHSRLHSQSDTPLSNLGRPSAANP
jgi:hypothetical protein